MIQAVNAFWRVKWALAFAAIVILGVIAGRTAIGATSYRLSVPMDNAAGLYPGSDVEIAGSKAGSVDSVGLADGRALVTVVVDSQHAPVRRDAKVALRPKSLLGEKYLDLDPGVSGETMPSGSRLPANSVTEPVQLEDVINTFDDPTRQKLTILIDELGAGVAGRGQQTNLGLRNGRDNMDDLAAVADTLSRRDADLEQVIQSLDVVLSELAKSDRQQQLGALIKNTDAIMANLADQDAQLKRALVQTNAALGRTGNALDGTAPSLGGIFQQAPTTVQQAGVLTSGLGSGLDNVIPELDKMIRGIQYGPVVFGGYDAMGYATRISANVAPGAPIPKPASVTVPSGGGLGGSPDVGGVFGFLLGGPTP